MQVRHRAWPLMLEPGQWLVAAGEAYPHADRIAPGDTVLVDGHLTLAHGAPVKVSL